ncbi:hypothetical protein M409DRAFT_71370 [Zasmidium cellare ATCC 36951]|uniref:Uncharacterized protein n=1 Tax=Zasmidium cellare ATCC 36951 TaxID=1080233 RepID=A0A6A6BVX4_ZASCE|nr:uncharacterized protein M409DRAFT_71370 [Zasmidium cellare ATCC 36951]KAF2158957.1 hypothetical protein M409DRAFT_71370 [Zasmidium cellare ATCC 36951]
MAQRTGPPRRDAMQRLLHRFYEPLQLLWMLNPARGQCCPAPAAGEQSSDFLGRWRRFLDALSWLCDFEHGGKTVSSVAVQALPSGNRFWLCCGHEAALQHLTWMLSLLEDEELSLPSQQVRAISTVAVTTISHSGDKVKRYARELSRYIAKVAVPSDVELSTETREMLRALDQLASLSDAEELCLEAVAFAHFDSLNGVAEASIRLDGPSDWSLVKHFVVRLRSWHQKAAIAVRFAGSFRSLLQDHTISWLPLPPSRDMPPSDAKTNLMSALKRMLKADEKERVSDLCQAMEDLRSFNFDQVFQESYSSGRLSLAVHSEVFLLEHFHEEGLFFVQNDRYIGCSKPSCYCCSLYMRYHPGNFVLRPSHGTAWVTWSPPLLSNCDAQEIRQRNLFVMNRVIEHLRRDVVNEIEHRFARRRRQPDSTSGGYTAPS